MSEFDGSDTSLWAIQVKVQTRIEAIEYELKALDANVARLLAFSRGEVSLKKKGYTRAAQNYIPTQADKARLPWTLSNLQSQRALWVRELEVLVEYGV